MKINIESKKYNIQKYLIIEDEDFDLIRSSSLSFKFKSNKIKDIGIRFYGDKSYKMHSLKRYIVSQYIDLSKSDVIIYLDGNPLNLKHNNLLIGDLSLQLKIRWINDKFKKLNDLPRGVEYRSKPYPMYIAKYINKDRTIVRYFSEKGCETLEKAKKLAIKEREKMELMYNPDFHQYTLENILKNKEKDSKGEKI